MGLDELRRVTQDYKAVSVLKRKEPEPNNDEMKIDIVSVPEAMPQETPPPTPTNTEEDDAMEEYEIEDYLKNPTRACDKDLEDTGKRRQLQYTLFHCRFCDKAVFDSGIELERHIKTDYQCSRLAQNEDRKLVKKKFEMIDNVFESASNLPRDESQAKKLMKVLHKEASVLFKELDKGGHLTRQQQLTYAEGLGLMKIVMKYGKLDE